MVMLQQVGTTARTGERDGSWESAVILIAQHIVMHGHMPAAPKSITEETWAEARRAFWDVEKAALAVIHWIVKNGDDCEATLQEEAFTVVLDDGEYRVGLKDVPAVLHYLTSGKDTLDALVGIHGLGLASPRGRAALRVVARNGQQDSDLLRFYALGLRSMRMVSRMAVVLSGVYGLGWKAIPNRMRLPSGLMVGIIVQCGNGVLLVPREQVGEFLTTIDERRGELSAYANWLVEA
jgi:hypothetical protein